MPTYTAYATVHALALQQHGVFTAEQARAAGVTAPALHAMVKRERLEKLAYGLYRDPVVPETRLTPYVTAVLWPYGTTGVLSHETALDLMELSDANPAKIHLTVPKKHRPRRRQPPPEVTLHFQDLARADIGSVEGLPVTTAARTIRDCAKANLGPALIRQAIDDGKRKGWLSVADSDALVAELTTTGKL
ncbi:MAG TPA: type IV toxin-antitoxin system AbiEi family antitoxin domain-containing protein [Gemmatimonadaceae bacterium]